MDQISQKDRVPIPQYHKNRNHIKKVEKISQEIIKEVISECETNVNYAEDVGERYKNLMDVYFYRVNKSIQKSLFYDKEYNLANVKKTINYTEFDKQLKVKNEENLELLLEKMNKIKIRKEKLEKGLGNILAKRIKENCNANMSNYQIYTTTSDSNSQTKEINVENALNKMMQYQQKYFQFYEGLFEDMDKNFDRSKNKALDWLKITYTAQQEKAEILEFLVGTQGECKESESDENNVLFVYVKINIETRKNQ